MESVTSPTWQLRGPPTCRNRGRAGTTRAIGHRKEAALNCRRSHLESVRPAPGYSFPSFHAPFPVHARPLVPGHRKRAWPRSAECFLLSLFCLCSSFLFVVEQAPILIVCATFSASWSDRSPSSFFFSFLLVVPAGSSSRS
ncbi:hypothetical protein MAPG_09934 [Magnaporthiopsis poae ATCC 64411]|uniref:Transmembrane protein n=1 Tax=Magnaporthiopsis poae (strain ATCC 64411 / 73-15) TaxID=644358 RepID=A0A0C4EB87_MAGP6|nr:hypothetical protein MAPG_09934 [Magnaporthiopsis poae ATCC 64411]